ncbi:MAG: rod shape-determining protein MreC [Lentisphaerae bacterium]|jgi:rod shape-determining protein MreC|nr:rod shape-determining protein MreC [Lentisphaerota bacterium]
MGTALLIAVLVVLWLSGVFRNSIASAVRDTNAPYARFFLAVRNLYHNTAAAIGDAASVRLENSQLRKEVEKLRASEVLLQKTLTENSELRKNLQLKQKESLLICAEIISRGEISGWWNIVRIDKGQDDGVELGAAVVSTEGLVGRIVERTSGTADVLLLTDANSRVSCLIEGTEAGARGILTGMGVQKSGGSLEFLHVVEPMSLSYLDKELEVKKGFKVVTSGLGGLYPSGIPVGEVVEFAQDSSRLYQRGRVAPYTDFASLKSVFVLSPTLSARAMTDKMKSTGVDVR